MTRHTRTPIWILATVLALTGCARHAGSATTAPQSSGQAGFGAVNGQSGTPTPNSTSDTMSDTRSSQGSGRQGSTTQTASPAPTRTGPQIVSFTTKGAVCPVDNPGLSYSSPGKVTISWKISDADTVDLFMDNGLYKGYPGQEGTDELPFQCDNTAKPQPYTVTHTYKLTIKNTSVSKTTSASARSNPH